MKLFQLADPPTPFVGDIQIGNAVLVGIQSPKKTGIAEWLWLYVNAVKGENVVGRVIHGSDELEANRGHFLHIQKKKIHKVKSNFVLSPPFTGVWGEPI